MKSKSRKLCAKKKKSKTQFKFRKNVRPSVQDKENIRTLEDAWCATASVSGISASVSGISRVTITDEAPCEPRKRGVSSEDGLAQFKPVQKRHSLYICEEEIDVKKVETRLEHPSDERLSVVDDASFSEAESSPSLSLTSCRSRSDSLTSPYSGNSSFRRISNILENRTTDRNTPPQLRSDGIGPPEQVWKLLCSKEKAYTRSPHLMKNHPTLIPSMRTVLLDWIMEVCESERLHRETFYLTVDFIDRFLSKSKDVGPLQLQMLGATALFIATKVEEIYPPRVETLANYTDGACNDIQIRECELVMLQTLEWSLSPVTPLHWLTIYMQLMSCDKENIPGGPLWKIDPSSRIAQELTGNVHIIAPKSCIFPVLKREDFISLAQVLDLCILDFRSLEFDYSMLAAAVFFCWFEPEVLIQQVTGYKSEQLIAACDFVEPFVRVCEKRRVSGDPLPTFENVPLDDAHNIQLYINGVDDWMNEAEVIRSEIEMRQRSAVLHVRRKKLLID